MKIDLENENDYIEGNIFVTPPFTKGNDISGNISNALDDLKSHFNNEINSNPEKKFGNLYFSKKDDISANIFKELDLKINLANKKDSTEENVFANTPSKKYDSSATIRDLYLKTDLEEILLKVESAHLLNHYPQRHLKKFPTK